jgi:ubiquinone/menaquinone biosynthesis C-methylase UbiE
MMIESGHFYDVVIDPILKSMRKKVLAEINDGETVIDIACGTGAQVFEMAKKAKLVVGVDLSESMMKFAQKKKQKQEILNVKFSISDATNLAEFAENEFDVATMSLALHQFTPEMYAPILNEMKRVAKRIVIVDYAVPVRSNFVGIISKTIEFMAGREHNRCYNEFCKAGGLNSILAKNSLAIYGQKNLGGGAFSLVNCHPV